MTLGYGVEHGGGGGSTGRVDPLRPCRHRSPSEAGIDDRSPLRGSLAEVALLGGVGRQSGCEGELRPGAAEVTCSNQQLGAGRVVGVVTATRHLVEEVQTDVGSLNLCDGDRSVQGDDRGGSQCVQLT